MIGLLRRRRRRDRPEESGESRALSQLRGLVAEALSKAPLAEERIDNYLEEKRRGTSTA